MSSENLPNEEGSDIEFTPAHQQMAELIAMSLRQNLSAPLQIIVFAVDNLRQTSNLTQPQQESLQQILSSVNRIRQIPEKVSRIQRLVFDPNRTQAIDQPVLDLDRSSADEETA